LDGADAMKARVRLNKLKSRRSGKTVSGKKSAQRSGHKVPRLASLDVTKPTFTDDLTAIFRRNIAKARRENKKLFGSPDGPLVTDGFRRNEKRDASSV
jgi:hypothetical protein